MDSEKCYKHQPEQITEATILCDFVIQTDRKMKSNRQDIVIEDYKNQTYLLIDMSVPTDNNLSVKEYDRISKHKDL